MNPQNSRISEETRPGWSACNIFASGTLGTRTPAERRLISRSLIMLVVISGGALVGFLTGFRPRPLLIDALALLPGVLLTLIAWEWRRYVLTLDELARRMQFEAAAWTYMTGLLVAMWLGGLAVVLHLSSFWTLLPARVLVSITFFLFSLLEIVRSFYLYRLSRRY